MDTIAAPITPLLTSAVIVVRVSGEDSFKCCELLMDYSHNLINQNQIRYRYVYTGYFLLPDGTILDEVVFYFFKSPNSFTGEDSLEISFHGNPQIVVKALETLYSLGVRAAEPGEFTKRAFLNNKVDLTQAESILDLIESKSEKGIFYSFNQLQGSLSSKIKSLKNILIDTASIVEAYVDFPEDDLSAHDYTYIQSNLETIAEYVKNLINSYNKQKFYREGLNIIIIGKPNVGKSSLLNNLVQKDRAIVSEYAGTTRDYIEEKLLIKGIPVNLVDTAGLRDSDSDLESIGIDKAKEKVKEADLVIVLLDISQPLSDEDRLILDISNGTERIVVGNKMDIMKSSNYDFLDICVSAKFKTNFEQLEDLIYSRLIFEDSEKMGSSVLINGRHLSLLSRLFDILKEADVNLQNDFLDLLSIDLNQALNIISEITGDVYTDEILDNIFSKFCLGK